MNYGVCEFCYLEGLLIDAANQLFEERHSLREVPRTGGGEGVVEKRGRHYMLTKHYNR